VTKQYFHRLWPGYFIVSPRDTQRCSTILPDPFYASLWGFLLLLKLNESLMKKRSVC
jgi:hypothetical protein